MAIHVIGAVPQKAPFDRTFFQATLGELLERDGKERAHHLSLHLLDGTVFEVCRIEDVAEGYLAVRTFRGSEDTCGEGLNLVPYGLISWIELAPPDAAAPRRLGFQWTPPPPLSLSPAPPR